MAKKKDQEKNKETEKPSKKVKKTEKIEVVKEKIPLVMLMGKSKEKDSVIMPAINDTRYAKDFFTDLVEGTAKVKITEDEFNSIIENYKKKSF